MEKSDLTSKFTASTRERLRGCTACGGKFYAMEQHDHCRHTCMTVTGDAPSQLPNQCWQKLAHPFARVLLAAIPAHLQKNVKDSVAITKRAEIGQDILANLHPSETMLLDPETLVEKHPPHYLNAFISRLDDSQIKEQIKLAQNLRSEIIRTDWKLRRPYKANRSNRSGVKRIKTVMPDLPPHFEEAISGYIDQSRRISDIKKKHGHRYSENTIRKREIDTWKFCEFLASKGVTHWPQVEQHHLDEYIGVENRHAATRIYTFLEFIRHHYHLTHKFVRPKVRIKPAIDAILPKKDMRDVLRRILKCPDDELIVVALLLALFAQLPVRSLELTYSRFRKNGDKIEALFATQWTPLDGLTTKYLLRIASDVGAASHDKDNEPIIKQTYNQIRMKLPDVLQVSVRLLRLAAVANLISSGITDRGALNRILGMSLPTLAYVESSFQWDLQSTVSPEMVKIRNEVVRGERM